MSRISDHRKASIKRKTKETDITLELDLDGSGKSDIDTPLQFLNHMLENFSKHSGFDLKVRGHGDTGVDDHHLVEDVGICLGEAIDKALDKKAGIERMAHAMVPFEGSLATVAIDLSGRPYADIEIKFSDYTDCRLGDISKENIPHFLESCAMNAKFNLYVRAEGSNDHHMAEASFKAFARALRDATRVSGAGIPSTKGKL